MPTPLLGKHAYISLDGNDISAYATDAKAENNVDDLDATTYGAGTSKMKEPGLSDNSFTCTLYYEAALTSIIQPLLGVRGKTLILGPMGNTSGYPKETYTGFVKQYSRNPPVDGLITADFEFAITGDVTWGTFT